MRYVIFGYSFVHLQVIKFKDHKDPLVRKTTISLVPVLAGFNPAAFNLSHLQPWATYMLAVMKKEKGPERSAAFLGMALALRLIPPDTSDRFLQRLVSCPSILTILASCSLWISLPFI